MVFQEGVLMMSKMNCIESKMKELNTKLYAKELTISAYTENCKQILCTAVLPDRTQEFFKQHNVDIMANTMPKNFDSSCVEELQNAVADTTQSLQILNNAKAHIADIEKNNSYEDKRIAHIAANICIPPVSNLLSHDSVAAKCCVVNDAKFLTNALSTNCASLRLACHALAFKYAALIASGAQYK